MVKRRRALFHERNLDLVLLLILSSQRYLRKVENDPRFRRYLCLPCNAEGWRQGGQLEATVVQARDDAQIFVKFWGEVESNFET